MNKHLSKRGYVYLIQSPTGFWKIGKTVDPKNRMATFSVKLPFEVEYTHLITCYDLHKLEAELHEVFSHRRVEGEWFKLSDNDIRWIKAIPTQIEFDLHLKNADLKAAQIQNQYKQIILIQLTKIEVLTLMLWSFLLAWFAMTLIYARELIPSVLFGFVYVLWSLFRSKALRRILKSQE